MYKEGKDLIPMTDSTSLEGNMMREYFLGMWTKTVKDCNELIRAQIKGF